MVLRNMYLGTYQNNRKPVVTVAPDTVIFINGRRVVDVCRECNSRLEVDSHATSVQTSLSLDGPGGGSATVTIQIPRDSNFPFVKDGRPFIPNFSEIEIYFKGHFLVNGLPRYYPAFWGIVTNITNSYSSGVHTYSMSCKDILHWWGVTKYTFSPALISKHLDSRNNPQAYKNRFANLTPIQIIVALARETFGEGIVPAFSSLNTNTPINETAPETIRATNREIINHWGQRQSQIMRAIRFLGADGGLVFDGAEFNNNICTDKADEDRAFAQLRTVPVITGTSLDNNLNLATDFNPFSELNTGGIQLFESDESSKLEIATAVKDWIGFEFYLDTTGEIVFKPPYYNLDVRNNFPVSWIRDQEILSWNFTEEEPEYTRLEVRGGLTRLVPDGPGVIPTGYHTDYNLARQYGIRQGTIQRNWVRDSTSAFLHAVTELDRTTTRRFTATVDIIGRPELRLGYPVYLESQDCFWYVTDISHGFSFGGQFTTTLGLTARRLKFADPTYQLVSPQAATDTIDENGVARDARGQNVGIRNAVLRLTRDPAEIQLALQHLREGALVEDGAGFTVENPEQADPSGYKNEGAGVKSIERAKSDRKHNRLVDMPTGLYVPDTNSAMRGIAVKYPTNEGERLILGGNASTDLESIKQGFFALSQQKRDQLGESITLAALPVSDENGYEVVGAFPYGRQLRLNENGTISNRDAGDQNARDFLVISPQAGDEPEPQIQDLRVIANDQGSVAGVVQVDQTTTGLVFQELQPERRTNPGCLCKVKAAEFDLEFIQTVFSGLFDPDANGQNPQSTVNQSTVPRVSITDQLAREVQLQTDPDVVSPTAADLGRGGRGDT